MNQNWQTDERFEKIAWDKRTFIINWIKEQQTSNWSSEKLLATVLSLNEQLKQKNMSFTKEEQMILSDILFDALSPQEQQRYLVIRQLLGKQ